MATPQTLFKTAAILNAIFVPAHIVFGLTDVHPAINSIPSTPQHRIGQRGAQNCYNYVNASLLVAALLNWQWARTGGPQTREEMAVFWTILGIGLWSGLRYVQVGEFKPLGCLVLAPACSVAALFML
ncbi:hypothetical protein W97_03959 [Coniosporium apollinis CBS 100218]|uniref:Ergosterol biosynthesis protein n=1 Tax=Coniosporium apollinis (strain CBS 100218) TaxID=1168221 RepID=R7YSV3_CONA1|nr:uncharacterized protein W97_03959 [Coniosporium apollinis CBS 100218]EON64726.1 hypothetical protein W97_03959 [Coniosporium apollinis CBS 100218]